MLTVSAFAEELIVLKQCQWLKKFNLNLILTCNISPPLPFRKKREPSSTHILALYYILPHFCVYHWLKLVVNTS